MQVQQVISLVSVLLGVLGSLFLSYDLMGKPGGVLRAFVISLTLAILSAVCIGLPTLAVAHAWPLPSPSAIDMFLLSRSLPLVYFGIGFFGGAVIYTAPYVPGNAAPSAARQREARSTYLLFGGLLFLLLLGGVVADGYRRTHSANYLVDYGAFLLGFLVLIPIGARVLYRLVKWVDQLPDKQLGAFGAMLTLMAFAIQLFLVL
jgi:hypothetical protein